MRDVLRQVKEELFQAETTTLAKTPITTEEYDDDDVIAMISSWLLSKKIGYEGFLVKFADIDGEFNFQQGKAKQFTKQAALDLGLIIDREGGNTVFLRRRIAIA